MNLDREKLQRDVVQFGTEIFAQIQQEKPGWLDSQYYTDLLLDWSMKDEEFKVSMFRFVDILPTLRDSEAVVRHAQEFADLLESKIPAIVNWGIHIDPKSLPAKVMARFIKRQVRSVAERFIVGENANSALKTLRKIRAQKMAFTIDLLGEATVSEAESEVYINRYLDLLKVLGKEVPNWPERQPVVAHHRGERSPINISVKLSALYSQARPLNYQTSVKILTERLAVICREAARAEAFVYVDMEDSALTSITLDVFRELATSPEFRTSDRLGIVLQAYLRRTGDDLEQLLDWTRLRGTPIGVRLVKGAYWDTETIQSRQRSWPNPVWQQKSSSDAMYEQLSLKLLENSAIISPAFASHNIRSLCFAVKAAEQLGVSPTNFELQGLYGMADPIMSTFAARGYLVRRYSPVGDLIDGMGYLVRRLLENTSNEGFLRQSFHEHESPARLLQAPHFHEEDWGTEHIVANPREEFRNAAFLDFSVPENSERVEHEVRLLRERVVTRPLLVTPIVHGVGMETLNKIEARINEDPRVKLAEISLADSALAKTAVEGLLAFYPTWRDTPVQKRADVLFKTALVMERRRFELIALMVLEEGKQWGEADGDVTEAIDFCNYYALEALRIGKPQELATAYPGERNLYMYEPRGVTAVIGPWNFPLAIPTGMFAAALVTGNPAVLKPAEQSSCIAYELYRCFVEGGLPAGAACFLPGLGEELGKYLVSHPQIPTIAFTGSRNVGLQIIAAAAKQQDSGMPQLKRVIAEMGGKNAIIVDDDADLDEAIKGTINSAFGYQGQKCSACSRVIVVGSAYERFIERLKEATRSILVGPASEPSALVGPVIDRDAFHRIQQVVEEARLTCKVIAEGPFPPANCANSYYIRPIVFGDIPKNHPLWTTEIFGPVLAVAAANSFGEALRMALDSEYALTGAVFSRSPRNIERAYREFTVGNLYINRGSTGALVNRQPFGGSKMSGVGSKAGGPDYLLQFVVPRAVSENMVRRGFTPIAGQEKGL